MWITVLQLGNETALEGDMASTDIRPVTTPGRGLIPYSELWSSVGHTPDQASDPETGSHY